MRPSRFWVAHGPAFVLPAGRPQGARDPRSAVLDHSHLTATNGLVLDGLTLLRPWATRRWRGEATSSGSVEAVRVRVRRRTGGGAGRRPCGDLSGAARHRRGRDRPPQIVHIDALDLYEDFEGDPLGHASLPRGSWRTGRPGITQLGIRTPNAHLLAQAKRYGVKVFAPHERRGGLAALPSRADLHLHRPGRPGPGLRARRVAPRAGRAHHPRGAGRDLEDTGPGDRRRYRRAEPGPRRERHDQPS